MKKALSKIRLGTRGSPLALHQTGMVQGALLKVDPALEVEIVVIKTSGDWRPEQGETRLIEERGGKGQFAREIEQALLEGRINAGVHSMKDMETVLPEGLAIRHMLPREDARDALLVREELRGKIGWFKDLPEGAVIGTASVRRGALALHKRPDLKIVPLRGNVETRIEKVRAGQVDATFLACAGLKRLGLEHEIDVILEPEVMLPAAGQGAVGIEIKNSDDSILAVFDQINCEETLSCVTAERAVLDVLDGSCHTPIGAYADLQNGVLDLQACVAALDGSEVHIEKISQKVQNTGHAEQTGRKLGRILKEKIPAGLLSQRIK